MTDFPTIEKDISMTGTSIDKNEIVTMGSWICDNCAKTKDVYGGKSCSKGLFICHSCSSCHVHCPLCGHTLR